MSTILNFHLAIEQSTLTEQIIYVPRYMKIGPRVSYHVKLKTTKSASETKQEDYINDIETTEIILS